MSVVVLSSFLGLGFFHERLSRVNWMGISLAIVAILLITAGI